MSFCVAAGDWIEGSQNLIIEAPSVGGELWLASTLGHKACDNRSLLYECIPMLDPV